MEIIQLTNSLPQPVYSAHEVLSHEAKVASLCHMSLFELMCKAGDAAFKVLEQWNSSVASILIVAGKGNNGGDGYVLAKHCLAAGYDVHLLVLTDYKQLKGDAKKAFDQLTKDDLVVDFQPCPLKSSKIIQAFKGEVIVDAIFGIGFRGELSLDLQQIIHSINSHSAQIMSIDIPSGLCASTGSVATTAVKSDLTVTFIVVKQGLLTGKAVNYVGTIWLATLSVQEKFVSTLTPQNVAQGIAQLPKILPRAKNLHKGNIGLALLVGGNVGMPGAIRLSAEAALRAGAALVSVTCLLENRLLVSHGRPELMLAPSEPDKLALSSAIEKAKVIIIGPGLGRDEWSKKVFNVVFSKTKRMVVDADALAIVKEKKLKYDDWVLTPHPGEAANLLDTDIQTIESDRFSAVKAIADKYGGTCVLKGPGSLISDGKQVFINTTGHSGMATGGMGDVLSGIIGALILQTGSIFEATQLAVSIHGQAAERATQTFGIRGLLASDLFEPIRIIVNQY